MRYLSYKPAFFLIIILSAALSFPRANSTARASSSLPLLTGEAAVANLKEQGLYSSLTEAARAARHDAGSLPAHFDQDASVEGREATSSPESSAAIKLPLVQLSRLTASDGEANDSYGWSVAASGDTVVVGAYNDTVGNNVLQGSAYVFVRSGGVWAFQQKLTADDGTVNNWFGYSVAISGDTIAIGAPHDKTGTNSFQGSVYVFVRSDSVWSLQQKLTAHDGEAGDQLGTSVSISGNTVVAGAFADQVGANYGQGSAYVFARSGGAWSFQQKLTANDGEAIDWFGRSVAISGGTIVAGAPLDNSGTNPDLGSAYVFVRSGTVWTQQQRLTANIAYSNDQFGSAVAINGDTAIIGAPQAKPFGTFDQGKAYIFVRTGGVWSLQQTLSANDGAAGDNFGSSVALNGDTALIGVRWDDIGTATGTELDQGSAYLFTRVGTLWGPRHRFTAQDGAARENFGNAVALSGDTAFVGAPHTKVGANVTQGALYPFGCGYVEQQTITGAGVAAGDRFGSAVAIDGDVAVIGSPYDTVGTASLQGSAHVFVRDDGYWARAVQLFANDGAAGDRFGSAVAISGNTIVISATHKNINGAVYRGAVYVFVRSGGTWIQQARLVAGDGAANDFFGSSVSISGNRVAVGSPEDEIGGKRAQGSVTLFYRSGTTWSLEKVLTANDGAALDRFGFSVSLSEDQVLVGAAGAASSRGAAYVFGNNILPWGQRAKLTDSEGKAGDNFGWSVALYGNTALVIRLGNARPQTGGAAFVFVGPPGTVGFWKEQARLILDDEEYSHSVALSDDTAVIGMANKTILGQSHQGAAIVIKRKGTVWSLQQPIVARDGRDNDYFGHSVAISDDTILIGAEFGGNINQGAVYALEPNCGATLARFTSVSAASFVAPDGLAPESIAAGFGTNLATNTEAALSLPLPTTLAGVSLKVTDGAGMERPAPLFFVSPGQINYVIPAGTSAGPATLTVMNANEPVASGEVQISSVAPGLFSADSSGRGVANAYVLRVKANGAQNYEPVAQFDSTQNRYIPAPIDLGPASDRVYLVFYGTGLRYRSSLSAVSCTIGGANSEALYAGAVPGFVGFDQVNVRLPRSLAGRGEVDVTLIVDGKAANKVRLSIR
ncbi:MAG: hypothetical protein MOB07_07755 [Acidobacteria bacterium]|nr:hypothetical protein [Acidobacteriota bacterium]